MKTKQRNIFQLAKMVRRGKRVHLPNLDTDNEAKARAAHRQLVLGMLSAGEIRKRLTGGKVGQ